jgi:hypothetical protein
MEALLLELITKRITEIVKSIYDNRQQFVVWDQPYVYEDLNKPHTNLVLNISDIEECKVYSVEKLLTHKCFQSFKKCYGCPIKIERHIITMQPTIQTIDDTLQYITASTWAKKFSVFLDGTLFNFPNKTLSVHFINSNEYVIHVCDKNKNGKLTLLYYQLRDYLEQ